MPIQEVRQTVFVCDKCNKEQTVPYPATPQSYGYSSCKGTLVIQGAQGQVCAPIEFILCPDCSVAFYKWFQKEKDQ